MNDDTTPETIPSATLEAVAAGSDAAAILDFAARTREATALAVDLDLARDGVTQFFTRPDGTSLAISPAGLIGYDPHRPVDRTFNDLHSFVAYIEQHGDDTTEIFVTENAVHAELDGRRRGLAGPHTHAAAWPLTCTPAYTAWTRIIGKPISQADLAEVLDEWLPTVVAPDAATVLELVEGFAVKSDVEFRAGQRLANGSQTFAYTVDNKPNQIVVPDHIDVQVTPYHHVAHSEVVRLKFSWRLREGKLSFTLKNADWALITERARATLVGQLAGMLTDTPVYAGR